MSPLDKLIMKTLIKKNCTDFIRHQIKFYLEFSRWALLTWGPNFFVQGSATDSYNAPICIHFHNPVSLTSVSHLSFSFHCTRDIQSRVGLCVWGGGGLTFPGFIWVCFLGRGEGGGQFLEQVSLHWTSPLNVSVLRWLHANRSWTSRFCFIWLVGGKNHLEEEKDHW